MTYPYDFTDPQTVFGDLVNMAVFPVTAINNVSGEWWFSCTFGTDIPDVNPNTPLVYTYPTACGSYEIVKVISCNRGSGYIAVQRAQEGTGSLSYGAGGHLVQEPTAGTYTALKNLLLLTQKFSGRMGTVLPGTCQPGNFFFRTDTGAFYACFTIDTWTQLNLVDHGALTGLSDVDAHTIYNTLVQAIAWHDALTTKHLTNAPAHDHSDSFSGAGKPVRKFKSGNLADRPAVQNAGDIYIGKDTKALYVSKNGSTWDQYSTVPRGTVLMFDTTCPSGWARVTTMDDKFPRGAPFGVWSGFGGGGAANHQHDIATLIAHTHTIPAIDVQSSSNGSHSHNVNTWSGSGSSTVPIEASDASSTTTIASGSGGGHSHSVTLGAATTGSAGVASPKTDLVDGRPSFITLIFCRKS
jgi:hypothetical protein